MENCCCGSEKAFAACCQPFMDMKLNAVTAEQTMRARYSSFVHGNFEYLKSTYDPSSLDKYNEEEIKSWSTKSQWLGLEIIDTQDGGKQDKFGTVEFKAKYKQDGQIFVHHELSTFQKIDQKWYFTDGKVVNSTIKRDQEKVGRNDPCPCGSGKKYKKCCGQ